MAGEPVPATEIKRDALLDGFQHKNAQPERCTRKVWKWYAEAATRYIWRRDNGSGSSQAIPRHDPLLTKLEWRG